MIPNLKILLADDNPDHVQLITEILYLELKAEVESVTKGEECLKKVIKNGYDLLLLDYLFPEISGLDILKEIIKKGNALPIIMLTGYGSEKVAVEAMKAGAIDYIVKSEDGFQSLSLAVIKAIEKDQLKKKLRQSEEKFKNLFESASDAIIYLDSSGRILDANIQAVEVFGVSKPEVLGKQLIRLGVVPPREIRAFLNSFADILAGREVIQDVCIKNKKGQEIALECSASLTKTDDKVTGVMFIARDITERKRAEEALRESQKRFQALTETTSDFVWEMDANGVYTYCSPQINELWGYKPEDMIGRTPFDRMIPEDREHAIKMFRTISESPSSFKGMETHSRDSAGRIIVLETSGVPFFDIDGRLRGYRGISRDITERKRAEEALRESEARLKEAQALGRIGSWEFDLDSRTVQWSDQVYRLYERDPAMGPPSVEEEAAYYSPEQAGILREYAQIAGEQGQAFEYDLEARLPSGRIARFAATMRPIRDRSGRIVKLFGTVQDITERKRAEEALRESEERFRTLYENSTIGLYRTTPDGRIHLANPALVRMLGYSSFDDLSTRNLKKDGFEPSYARTQFVEIIEKDGEVKGLESAWKRKDGIIIFIRESARAIRDSQAKTLYYDGTVEDITERKRAEEAVRKSEEKYRGLTENINLGIYRNTVGPEGQFIEANPALIGMFGYKSKEEFLAINVSDLYQNPEDRTKFNDKMLKEGVVRGEELWLKKKDGSLFVGSVSAVAVKDEQGHVKYYDGIIDNITERKQTEEAIRESEEKYRGVVENIGIGVSLISPNMEILTLNHQMNKWFPDIDISKKPICYQAFNNPPSEKMCSYCPACETLQDGLVHEAITETPSGNKIINYRIVSSPIKDKSGKIIAAIEMVEDITERKRAEEALRESELSHRLLAEYNRELNDISIKFAETRSEDELFERVANSFRTLTRAFASSTSRYDDQTNTLAVASVSIEANVGADVNAMLKGGLLSMKMTPPPPVQQQMLAQVIARPRTLTELTFGVVAEDVSTQIMQFLGIDRIIALSISHGADILGTVVSFQSGIEKHIPDEALKTFAYMAGIAIKKRRAEEALRMSEAGLRAVLTNALVVMFAVDPAGVVTLAEGRGLAALGVTPEQIVGRRAYDFFPEQPLLQEGIQRALTGEAFSTTGQVAGLWFDGRLTPLPGPDNRVVGAIGVAMDITERKRAEEEIRRKAKDLQEKNEELTRFTSSVSHDLRSPLVTIQTFQGHLERDIRSRDAVRVEKDLDYIRNAADKMGRLLDDLLRFSRIGRIMNPSEETPLQAIVKEALDLVAGRITGRGVRIDLTEEPVVLYGDRTRLVEVFLNLVDNAVKFMGDEPAPWVEIGVEQAGEELVLHVRDNGIGIDPELQPMLFDLFHKLDPETEGEGIGLALVKRIVELHGGRIWVESEGLGKGTTFRFTLAKTRRRRAEEEKP
jgi:PAS domain S-box-containing protein